MDYFCNSNKCKTYRNLKGFLSKCNIPKQTKFPSIMNLVSCESCCPFPWPRKIFFFSIGCRRTYLSRHYENADLNFRNQEFMQCSKFDYFYKECTGGARAGAWNACLSPLRFFCIFHSGTTWTVT